MLTDHSRKAIATCSTLAIAAALSSVPHAAKAQVANGSFQANGSFDSGSGNISVGTNTTSIRVDTPQAVIDWNTDDIALVSGGAVIFQPENTTATFFSSATGQPQDFAVLNRISNSQALPVQFNGRVVSELRTFNPSTSGTTVSRGGTVFFSSPNGLVLGPTSVFDVGNLGLTSAEVVVDADGQFIADASSNYQQGTVQFGPATIAGSGVEIRPGARINAPLAGSYVAVVAPRVNHGGRIEVNGSAALVSADAATITFSPTGLFDIAIPTGQVNGGTSATGTTLTNSGVITNPADTVPAGDRRAYLVAVPKNTAITMAITAGSELGFGVANAAQVLEDGSLILTSGDAVVLSAGYDIVSGEPSSGGPVNNVPATIAIDDGIAPGTTGIAFTSTLFAKASSDIAVDIGRASRVDGDAGLVARERVVVQVDRLTPTAAAGALNIGGSLTILADRFDPLPGANLDAGFTQVNALDGGAINVGGNLSITAQARFDDNGDGIVGARATSATTSVGGGVIAVQALAGSTIAVGGNMTLDGLSSAEDASPARGANVSVQSSGGSTISVGGAFTGRSDGFGGFGGTGMGHFVNVIANGGTIEFDSANISASGFGGFAFSGQGGTGQGGTVVLSANDGPNTPGQVTIVGNAFIRADGQGTSAFSGNGGNGIGGFAQVDARFGGAVSIGGLVDISANGFGATSFDSGFSGGLGQGGTARLLAASGGMVSLSGDVDVGATGFGGDAGTRGAYTGSGQGGRAEVLLNNATVSGNLVPGSSTITVDGDLAVTAQGSAGDDSCSGSCFGIGGSGTGGIVRIAAETPGHVLQIGGEAGLQASGFGGDRGAGSGAAGSAIGGTVDVFANSSSFSFGSLALGASAIGGNHFAGGTGGSANAGVTRVSTVGSASAPSTITVDGDVRLQSTAIGGSAQGAGSAGGDADNSASTTGQQRGLAEIDLENGSLAIAGRLNVTAAAEAGSADARGGTGRGGEARIATGIGGALDVASFLRVEASGSGGNGDIGGDGFGGTAALSTQPGTINARAATLVGEGVLLGSFIGADGVGGGGLVGGDGFGGRAEVIADTSTDGPVSSITLVDALVSANGVGGFDFSGSSVGDPVGAGGDGFGGTTVVGAVAGNGTLTTGSLIANALGIGGEGGFGSAGPVDPDTSEFTGPGGAGGAAGQGVGGSVTVGIGAQDDDDDLAANTGAVSLGAFSADASGIGGTGGAGGQGTVRGNGGAGGGAIGGDAQLLALGGPVAFSTGTVTASGLAGDGGAGGTAGAGGAAQSGSAQVRVTNRENLTGERGSLTGTSLFVTAEALGGAGSTAGTATIGGRVAFDVINGDVDLTDATFRNEGEASDTVELPDLLSVSNGTVNATNSFSFITGAPLTVQLDDAAVNTANLTLQAPNWILADSAPGAAGTFFVSGEATLTSEGDLVTFANFDLSSDELFQINGAFRTGDYTSTGSVRVEATGPITIGNLSVVNADLLAAGSIDTGSVNTSGYADFEAIGSLSTGSADAGGFVDFSSASSSVSTGSISSGEGTTLRAGTSLVAGDIDAGIDPETTFSIGLAAGVAGPGDLQVGNLTGESGIGLLSLQGSIVAGDVETGTSLLALARDAVSLGSIATGTSPTNFTYIANASMAALGGSLDSFNPVPIFQAAPVATSGPITIAGAITTGNLRASSAGAITVTGPVSTTATTLLRAGQGVSVDGSVTAGQLVSLLGGSGAITAGSVSAGGAVNAFGNGISLGDITAGRNATLAPGANVILSAGAGAITAGTVVTPASLLALAVGDVAFGSITTGTAETSYTYIANSSQAALGTTPTGGFNPAAIFVSDDAAPTAGSITITGPVTTGNFVAAAGDDFTVGTPGAAGAPTTGGAIDAAGFVDLAAGGSMLLGTARAGEGGLDLVSGGDLVAGDLSASSDIETSSGGATSLGDLDGFDIVVESGGLLTAGAILAQDSVTVVAQGDITLGDVSASLGEEEEPELDVGIASIGGSVTVGNVSTLQDIGILAGGGGITAGNLDARRDVLLLATETVNTSGITAGPSGRILIGNASLIDLDEIDFDDLDEFDAEPIFATTTLAPVEGDILIGGTVTGGVFRAAATDTFSAPTMTLGQSIAVDPDLVRVLGPWTAPTIDIDAGRLDFASEDARLTASQSITLRALPSGQQAVLGGTVRPEGGFVLTQADFARIRTPNLTIRVEDQGLSSSTPDLLVRDLTLTGSAISGGLAQVTIATPGWARIAGDLLLAQAGAENTLSVAGTQRLEIVLPDASVGITSGTAANGPLAGTLTLSSNNLVAATLDLLQQAMTDPAAAGLAEALRTPAGTAANLDGYIRGNNVNLLGGANILLQNSGTPTDFAGVTVGGNLIIGRLVPTGSGSSGGGTGGSSGGSTGGGSIGSGAGTRSEAGFSFVGMLVTPSDVAFFDFSVDAASNVTLRSYSYAGGTNAAGQVIARGGFDPILAVYNAAGQRIGQSDDGPLTVPADSVSGLRYDTNLAVALQPGNYKAAVSVFSNFGPSDLSQPFPGETSFADTTGNSRTPNFAFDVLGARVTTATVSVGQQPNQPSGPLNLVGFGRRVNADGTVTANNDFFATINFNNTGDNPIQYTANSQFNTCLVSTGCVVVPPPRGPLDDPEVREAIQAATTTIATEFRLLTLDVLMEEPFVQIVDPGTTSQQDENQADEARSPIAPPAPLIDTRPLNATLEVSEPVSGSGNPALIGSSASPSVIQESQP